MVLDLWARGMKHAAEGRRWHISAAIKHFCEYVRAMPDALLISMRVNTSSAQGTSDMSNFKKATKIFLANYSYTSKCVQGFYQVRIKVDKLQPARCQQSVGDKHAWLLLTTVIHLLFTYLLLIVLKISVNKSEIERILRCEPQTSSTNYVWRKRVRISQV